MNCPTRPLTLALVFVGMAVAYGAAQDQAGKPADDVALKIDELIVKLDDDNFQVREDAEKALAAFGERAIDPLTKATRSPSAEVRQRAGRVLRVLRQSTVGLRQVATVSRDDLPGICSIAISPDGKFLYAAAFQTNTLAVFQREVGTGSLSHIQSLQDPANLSGVVSIELSADGKRATSVAFRSKKVALLTRDVESGKLTVTNAIGPELAPGAAFQWPIDGTFSPDGKHVYVVDDRGGSLTVFEVTAENQLQWVQTSVGRDGCLAGARGVAISPDGKTLLVTSQRAGTLSVLDRDPATGRVEVRQVFRDGEEPVTALQGAHGVTFSPDGAHAYATIGRFGGDQAVAAYRLEAGTKVSLVKELVTDKSDLVNFQGGNGLVVTPDGKNVFACGSVSGSLACFTRDGKGGEISWISTQHNEHTGAGIEPGAADVEVSPDGRFLYLAIEGRGAITVFERTVKH